MRAWGLQFHIEAPAEVVRDWARGEGLPTAVGSAPMLDAAEETMAEVWRGLRRTGSSIWCGIRSGRGCRCSGQAR